MVVNKLIAVVGELDGLAGVMREEEALRAIVPAGSGRYGVIRAYPAAAVLSAMGARTQFHLTIAIVSRIGRSSEGAVVGIDTRSAGDSYNKL